MAKSKWWKYGRTLRYFAFPTFVLGNNFAAHLMKNSGSKIFLRGLVWAVFAYFMPLYSKNASSRKLFMVKTRALKKLRFFVRKSEKSAKTILHEVVHGKSVSLKNTKHV